MITDTGKPLAEHLATWHPSVRFLADESTADLVRLHIRAHNTPTAALNHRHGGNDGGPGERPSGWLSGGDVEKLRPHLRFGYNRGLPDDVTAAWGCRAIIHQDGYTDFVPDRADSFGDDKAWGELQNAINAIGRDWLLVTASQLLKTGEMSTREDAEYELFNDGHLVIKGNPQASHGYLYVCAYLLGKGNGNG